jgi:hypothetical protein
MVWDGNNTAERRNLIQYNMRNTKRLVATCTASNPTQLNALQG